MAETERFLIDNAVSRAADMAKGYVTSFATRFPRKAVEQETTSPEAIARRALRITRGSDF